MWRLAFILMVIWMWPLAASAASSYPDRIPVEDIIGVFPFAFDESVEEFSEEVQNAVIAGVRQADNDVSTAEQLDRQTEGEYNLDAANDCKGDVDLLLPMARAAQLSWFITGEIREDTAGVSVRVWVVHVASGETQRRRLVEAGVFEELDEDLRDTVAEMILGEPVEEAAPAPELESVENLGYEIGKWLTLGVGAGLVGTGVTFAIFAKDKQDQYNDKYAKQAFVDKDLKSEAETNATIANATLISGGIVLAGSVVLFVLDGLDIGEHPLEQFGFGFSPDPRQPGGSVLVRY